jgi:hypothetical protein
MLVFTLPSLPDVYTFPTAAKLDLIAAAAIVALRRDANHKAVPPR